MGDLGAIEYFFGLMEDSVSKLGVAIGTNNISEANKIKNVILDLSKKIREELV